VVISCVQNLHENRPSLRGRAAASIEPKMSDVTASVNYSHSRVKNYIPEAISLSINRN